MLKKFNLFRISIRLQGRLNCLIIIDDTLLSQTKSCTETEKAYFRLQAHPYVSEANAIKLLLITRRNNCLLWIFTSALLFVIHILTVDIFYMETKRLQIALLYQNKRMYFVQDLIKEAKYT